MKITETIRDLAGLISKISNVELSKKIVDLQTEAIDLIEENHQLRDDLRVLKSKLATREQLTFDKNAYWLSGDGPFCSRCFDKEGTLVRLHAAHSSGAVSWSPQCPNCKRYAIDPTNERGSQQIQRERRNGEGLEISDRR